MKTLLNALKTKDNMTTNGMTAHSTTDNDVLDFFFLSGGSRNLSDSEITNAFIKAYNANKNLAMKALFYAGDVREGQGERRLFRVVSKYLYNKHSNDFKRNIAFIPEFTRWDNLLFLVSEETKKSKNALSPVWDDPYIWNLFIDAFKSENGLAAKWFPRKGLMFEKMAGLMGMSFSRFRKMLVKLTEKANVVEQKICSNNWWDIEYSKVASKAFNKYKKAFNKHDPEGFTRFITKVLNEEAKINASVLFPSDVIGKYLYSNNLTESEKDSVIAIWNSLPNYLEAVKNSNILVVADVSGSMSGQPMEVSVSLAMYISERNNGIFKDSFLTFSSRPALQVLKGDIFERISQLKMADAGLSTDLEKTFNLILEKAVENNVSEEGMPKVIFIISDMQFNEANGRNFTAFEMIENKYKKAGYRLPKIVFWNVNGSPSMPYPAKGYEKYVGLVSGFSPNIAKTVLETLNETPIDVMKKKLLSKRYENIFVR